ncbi:transcriptional regulator [Salinisphaera sp. C84B14]|uniref:RrF2 family transcriptional regulator n=1 Tax=Salinisphaera sp. C84B14 TaxID=1304155 RepID=UPI00333E4884
MQLTTHTDYALRLLIFVAVRRDESPARVQDAAARYGISANHLAKVAQTLVQLGYLDSFRGRGGGIALAVPAESINIGALVRQTENLRLLECFGPGSTCPIDPACTLKRALAEAQQAFLEVLDGYHLSDLVANGDTLRMLLGRP